MTFLGGGGWPQRHHASCIVRYICWLHSPTSTQSIKLQCTLVTKTIVNHLKPKKQRRKLPTPFRIWYIRYLIINYQYQHNHTFLFQWSIWQTLKVKTTESKQNINLYNGKNVCIKETEIPTRGGVLLYLACEIWHSKPGASMPPYNILNLNLSSEPHRVDTHLAGPMSWQ